MEPPPSLTRPATRRRVAGFACAAILGSCLVLSLRHATKEAGPFLSSTSLAKTRTGMQATRGFSQRQAKSLAPLLAREAAPLGSATRASMLRPWAAAKPEEPTVLTISRELPEFKKGLKDDPYDLLVVGAGPAGLGVADEAVRRGLSVGIIDPNPLQRWPNNYGVWVDEFEDLGHADCFMRTWNGATVVIDDKNTQGIPLNRPYAQVDRDKLKVKLLERAIENGLEFREGKVEKVEHFAEGSAIMIDGQEVHGRQVLDATGHSRRLVEFEREFTPGYQAAYGATIEVESHSYELDKMMFMDWRDDHLDERSKKRNEKLPTFLYVMPYSPTKIFVEETSLVARPFIPFDELKDRLRQRLQGLGITVKSIEDEEYCLIPMGGVLPKLPQRTLGIGGTAGMVHPATGYMVSKTLYQAPVLVDALKQGLEREASKEDGQYNATSISTGVWDAIWPNEDKRQRTFMCFGMEILMELDVATTRRFFSTFFKLSQEMWGGFLSWRISSLGLLGIGLSIFRTASNELRRDFVLNAIPYMPTFVKNFASADNNFESEAWAGLYAAADKTRSHFNSTGGLSGSNPTSVPITSSNLDFKDAVIRDDKDDRGDGSGGSVAGLGKPGDLDTPQDVRSLGDDRDWIRFQQEKSFDDQVKLVDALPRMQSGEQVDVLVGGVGPSGLAVAGALASRGIKVGLVGPDAPFTNNYGVWVDEFEEIGLAHTIVEKYEDTLVMIDEEKGMEAVGRQYGRVGRKELRDELLSRCKGGNVVYYPGLIEKVEEDGRGNRRVELSDGEEFTARMVTMSTGHNREVLTYEKGDTPLWQTAYGIELKMKDHHWDPKKAVFMDLTQSDDEQFDDGLQRVPSFLYVLPSEDKVFVEETCLISKVQVPFDELKRRLYKRLEKLGIEVTEDTIIEEEASWIPLGGSLPKIPQPVLGFGAAAGLVHPASGYSIVNSLSKAGEIADHIVEGLQMEDGSRATQAWESLWSMESRRKMAFYQFGAEMIAKMPLTTLQEFMRTFYALPAPLWKGFLSHRLSSPMLIPLAVMMFFLGNNELKKALVSELASPAGVKMFQAATAPIHTAEGRAPEVDAVMRRTPPQEPLKDVFRREQLGMGSLPSGFVDER